MNTVIVPVDFSDTSLHAARYAAQLLVGHGVTLILYHSYSKPSELAGVESDLENLQKELFNNSIVFPLCFCFSIYCDLIFSH